MSPIEQYNKMHQLVKKAHLGQMYGEHPYLYHSEQVDKLVTQVNSKKQILKCMDITGVLSDYSYSDVVWLLRTAALAHDLYEDTEWKENDLLDQGFNLFVELAVIALTKKPDECKKRYLVRLCRNPWAVLIKKADSFTNLLHSLLEGHIGRVMKYTDNLQILGGEKKLRELHAVVTS